MHFLTHAADVMAAMPLDTVTPPGPNNGSGAAPGFTGTLVTNGRNLMIGAIVVLLLAVTAFGIAVGALRGNMKRTLVMVIATLVSLIPAGIVLGVGFVAVATGVVTVSGF